MTQIGEIPAHLWRVVHDIQSVILNDFSGVLDAEAAQSLAEKIVLRLVDEGAFVTPERCQHIVAPGSTNLNSPNFGDDEICEHDALIGSDYCAAHI